MEMKLIVQLARISALMMLALYNLNACAESDATTSIAVGLDSNSGQYGTANVTRIVTIPVIGKYETDSWSFKLTVPYIRITTFGGVLPGMGASSKKVAISNRASTQSGPGDVVAATTYFAIYGTDSTPGLDITGKVKLPTASKTAGLGTGETDYFLQLDGYQKFNQLTVYGSVGRKFLGSSDDIPLHDVNYGSIGASYQFSEKISAGLNLDAAQASSAAGSNQLELTVSVVRKLEKGRKVQGYLLKGLADGSPDTGIGVLLTFVF